MHNSYYNQKPTRLNPCHSCGGGSLTVLINMYGRKIICGECDNTLYIKAADKRHWKDEQSMGIMELIAEWNKANPHNGWRNNEYIRETSNARAKDE